MSRSGEPAWRSAAWITAMVGVVSAFLTIPKVVGDYFIKREEVQLAKETIQAARLDNLAAKQEQEFQVVRNALAQQGPERVFVLRYLAATHDQRETREWAQSEVEQLDELTRAGEEIDRLGKELEGKEAELAASGASESALAREVESLRADLSARSGEIRGLQQRAGLGRDESVSVVADIYLDWSVAPERDEVAVRFVRRTLWADPNTTTTCRAGNAVCRTALPGVPDFLLVGNGPAVRDVSVWIWESATTGSFADYVCEPISSGETKCVEPSMHGFVPPELP